MAARTVEGQTRLLTGILGRFSLATKSLGSVRNTRLLTNTANHYIRVIDPQKQILNPQKVYWPTSKSHKNSGYLAGQLLILILNPGPEIMETL